MFYQPLSGFDGLNPCRFVSETLSVRSEHQVVALGYTEASIKDAILWRSVPFDPCTAFKYFLRFPSFRRSCGGGGLSSIAEAFEEQDNFAALPGLCIIHSPLVQGRHRFGIQKYLGG